MAVRGGLFTIRQWFIPFSSNRSKEQKMIFVVIIINKKHQSDFISNLGGKIISSNHRGISLVCSFFDRNGA